MIGRTSLIVSMHPVLQIEPSSREFRFVRHQPDADTGISESQNQRSS
jgi:hypothetical protein